MSELHPAIAKLSLEEKASLVSGASFWATRSVEHAGIEGALLTDGPHGVRLQREGADHLGLHDSVPATAFPTGSALGSSWDPVLLAEVGEALGRESRALGVDILLGPGVNMKRSPLCGRNFEYLSEDPHHAGVLGAAWVSGLQSQGVGASLKHYAANNQETDRMRVSAEVDERTLREIYLPAFETVVRTAKPATVMCSYNKVNGVYASENHWLLTEVLRDEWEFDGYVVSDWGAVSDSAKAVGAGLDLEMPSPGEAGPRAVAEAVRSGSLSLDALDTAVSRVLTVHDRIRADRGETQPIDVDTHHALARRASRESAVLLTNANDVLPLDPNRGGTIAVVGAFAQHPRYQGSGSSHIIPTRLDNALDEITAAAGQRSVVYAQGFSFDGSPDPILIAEAVEVARDAEVVVLFLGLPDSEESEGFDRQHIELPQNQTELLDALVRVNPATVVVLSNGGVVRLSNIVGRVPAILEMWLGGQASGGAVADLLFGLESPSGRLAETVPAALTHTPSFVNWPGTDGVVHYGERHYIGYRWYDATDRDVTFPFGHGLSYTSFDYSNLQIAIADTTEAVVDVSFTVTNVGQREGADVAQVYVRSLGSSVDRPVRELRGFRKVKLQPGESSGVKLRLTKRDFAIWGSHGWVVEQGDFAIDIGSSSRNIHLSGEAILNVPVHLPALNRESTLSEWLAHPSASGVLPQLVAGLSGGMDLSLGADDQLARLAGAIPLLKLLRMNDPATAEETVEHLLASIEVDAPIATL